MRRDLRRGNDEWGALRVVAALTIAVVVAIAGLVLSLAFDKSGSHKLQINAGDVSPGVAPGASTSTSACSPCDASDRPGKKSPTSSSTTTAAGKATGNKSAASTAGGSGDAAGAVATTPPPAPGGYQCGTDPQFSSNAYQYNNIVNSNGFNTYVQNNMWGAQPGTTARLCTRSPGDWTIDTSTQRDDGGAVQTYPQVQQLFNDFCDGTWNTCSDGTSTPISRLTKLTSSYAIATPSVATGTGTWEVAFDLWLSNTPQSEIMVWVVTSAERGTGGADVKQQNVSIGGASYNYQVYGGNLPQLVLTTNQSNGTIDLLGVLKFLQAQKLNGKAAVSPGASLDQLDFGIEICDTHGRTLHFATSGYGIAAAAT